MKRILFILLFCVSLSFAQVQTETAGVLTAASTDCTDVSSCVTITQLPANVKSVVFTTQGVFTADARFEGTYDGIRWAPLWATPLGAASDLARKPVNGALTSGGAWTFGATGLRGVRVRCNALYSGAAQVEIRAFQ